MSMEHIDDYANKGYSFKETRYTRDKLIEIMDYSNMVHDDYIDILRYQDIDDEFVMMYLDRFKRFLNVYAQYYRMGDDMIMYLYDNGLFNDYITSMQYLSETVINRIIGDDLSDKKNFIDVLLTNQQMSDENLIRFAEVADYSIMFKYQKISEELADSIESISDEDEKHTMFTVGAIYQWWSDEYVEDHADYIDWFRYYIYPERVRIPYTKMDYFLPDDPNGYHPDDIEWPILSDEVDPRLLNINNKHVPIEYWRKLISTQFDMYECTNDYFIGYMITTFNDYSIHDYKLPFTDGDIVEKHADITNTRDSFGIDMRSLFELKHLTHDFVVGDRVGSKKIKLVKAYYSDVCCAYKSAVGYTIRVRKVEVIRDYES